MCAANQGHLEIMNLLLQQPGIEISSKSIRIQFFHNISIQFNNGIPCRKCFWNSIHDFYRTALLLASITGYTNVVERLINLQGDQINEPDICADNDLSNLNAFI